VQGRLAGKVAIITGGAKGIGKGIAQVFAGEGARVVLAGRDESSGRETEAEIIEAGGDATFMKADITKQVEMVQLAEQATSRYGTIDILVSNAGIYPNSPIETMSEADWDKVFNVNLKAAFFAVQAVIPEMMKKKHGRILFTSSITGPRTAIPGLAHYAASKGGVNGFIKGLALDLARFNITVNGVEPGNVVSPGMAAQLGEEWMKACTARTPLNRLGTPEDVARAHLFLASDEASYITGQTIIVDGGQTIVEAETADG
jgi:3-oxoacyl-[acyl-carrier protein] reductase